MSIEQVLFRDDSFAVVDYQCGAKKGERGAEEQAGGYEIAFVRRGLFRVTLEGHRFVATRNENLFFSPGDVYRIDHPVAGGDSCAVVSFLAAMAHSLAETAGRNPFARHRAVCHPRSYAAHLLLLHSLRAGADPLFVQETIAMIATCVMAPAIKFQNATATIRTIQEVLAANSHRKVSLIELADLANVSPFHLSRSFKAATGLPIHQYVIRLRLRDALHRLENGENDLTRLALDVGYSNHAHFTTAFGHEFGITPSDYRKINGVRSEVLSSRTTT